MIGPDMNRVKTENMKIRDLMNSKKNGDDIVETQNEENENDSDMEKTNVQNVNLLVKIKLGWKFMLQLIIKGIN